MKGHCGGWWKEDQKEKGLYGDEFEVEELVVGTEMVRGMRGSLSKNVCRSRSCFRVQERRVGVGS